MRYVPAMKTLQVACVLFAGLGVGCSHSSANLPGGGAGAGGSGGNAGNGGTSGMGGMAGIGGSGGTGGSAGGGAAGTGGTGGQLPTTFDTFGVLSVQYAGTNQVYVDFASVSTGMGTATATVIGPCILSNLPDGATRIYGQTITITDAKGLETLPSNSQGNIKLSTVSPPINAVRWMPGDVLTIDSAGTAAFGAFHVTTTMPEGSFFSTTWSSGVPENVPRNADLALKWTGGSDSFIGSFWSLQDPMGRSLDCEFPAADGQGTVPAAALSMLPTGATMFSFSNSNAVRLNVSGAYLTVSADADMLQNQGQPYSITLQ